MSKNLVTAWNASPSILKVGEDKIILKPAETIVIELGEEVRELVYSGKLILAPADEEKHFPKVNIEPQSRKKNKKDTVQEDSTETQEIEVLEENNNQPSIEETEVSEDSILPEESV
jgi:hypothetical protein